MNFHRRQASRTIPGRLVPSYGPLLNSQGSFLPLTVTGDDVNNQTLNTRDEFGIEIIVEECDGYLGRGRIASDLRIPNLACGWILWRLMSHQFSVGYQIAA